MIKTLGCVVFIGAICAGVLVLSDAATRADIQKNRQQQAAAIAQILLGAERLPELNLERLPTGQCNDWVLMDLHIPGYAGLISFMGLSRRDSTPPSLSLRVTAHRETPGIGDFIDHRHNPWLAALDQTPAGSEDAIDGVSGATITFRAVQRAFRQLDRQTQEYCGE